MSTWRHLFIDGEYAKRQRILADLGADEVGSRPGATSHSIYEELWHITKWQNVILSRTEEKYQAWLHGPKFPAQPAPENEAEWQTLVDEFLTGLATIVQLSDSERNLVSELTHGYTFREGLEALATHNAFHLGKIVAIRQMMGRWADANG
jgi:uncharacterized damage-inducible protein DinB